jgi:Tfp pilus assembly protein PilO
MKRSQLLLSILAATLVVALFSTLLYRPTLEDLAALEASIAEQQTIQAGHEAEVVRLRAVRETAPEVEAQLAAAEAIIPRDAALPSALRQLQLAAEESGVVLQSVSTGRPVAMEGAAPGLSALGVSVVMSGGYFQIVDFLRRIEDPSITPRGLTWSAVTVSRGAYPTLEVSLAGQMYAVVATPIAPTTEPVEEAEEAEDGVGGEGADVEPGDGTPGQTEDAT